MREVWGAWLIPQERQQRAIRRRLRAEVGSDHSAGQPFGSGMLLIRVEVDLIQVCVKLIRAVVQRSVPPEALEVDRPYVGPDQLRLSLWSAVHHLDPP